MVGGPDRRAIAGRGPGLVGHCVNFLPIRGGWTRETSLADHLRARRQARCSTPMSIRTITLGTMVRNLSLPRAANRLPLTELQFNLERLADRI